MSAHLTQLSNTYVVLRLRLRARLFVAAAFASRRNLSIFVPLLTAGPLFIAVNANAPKPHSEVNSTEEFQHLTEAGSHNLVGGATTE